MRCPQCMHDSINPTINNKEAVVIRCDNCENEFTVENSPLLELVLYNYDAERVMREGRMAFLEGVLLSECPYDDDFATVWSREQWIRGWKSEQDSMGEVGNILSAKKENEEVVEDNKKLSKELRITKAMLEQTRRELKVMNQIRNGTITDLSHLKGAKYWKKSTYIDKIGEILQKDCEKFMNDIPENQTMDFSTI